MESRSRGVWTVVGLLLLVGVLWWMWDDTPPTPDAHVAIDGVTEPPKPVGDTAGTMPAASARVHDPRQADAPPAVSTQASDASPMELHRRLLGIEPEATLILKNAMTGPNGEHHFRYEQAYRGIPVANHNFVVHEPEGGALSTSGDVILDFAVQVPTISPRLSRAEAISIATRHVAADHTGRLEIERTDVALQLQRDDGRRLHLAYMVTIDGGVEGEQDPLGEEVAVDALTGEVVAQQRTWND